MLLSSPPPSSTPARSPPFLSFLPSLSRSLENNNNNNSNTKKTKQEFKGSDFGWHKTKIAQMLTVKRERELAEGVSKRDSRAAEKRAKVEAGFGQF